MSFRKYLRNRLVGKGGSARVCRSESCNCVVEVSSSQRADGRVQSLARARGGHSTLALPGLGLARGLSFCFDFGLGLSLSLSLGHRFSLGHRHNIGLSLSLDLGHSLGFGFGLSLGLDFCLSLGVGLGHSLDLWYQSWSVPKPLSSSLTQTATHPQ